MAPMGERSLDVPEPHDNTGRVQAIVTALDEPRRQRIEDIWGELRAVFGLRGLRRVLIPHFTYQLAERYDDPVERLLGAVAAATPPFEVETHGLGIQRGPRTLLYLHVTRIPALDALHARLWRETAAVASGPNPAYAPATWIPHVTIAAGDIDESQLADISAFLARHDYRWRLPVTNLCLVPDTTSANEPWVRWEVGARSS